jgi:hypothetical protein
LFSELDGPRRLVTAQLRLSKLQAAISQVLRDGAAKYSPLSGELIDRAGSQAVVADQLINLLLGEPFVAVAFRPGRSSRLDRQHRLRIAWAEGFEEANNEGGQVRELFP